MKLVIYKGFDKDFLQKIEIPPLVEENIESKVDVFTFDVRQKRKLRRALEDFCEFQETDDVWITYQEFSLIKSSVDESIQDDDLKVVIYNNNLYPNYYPIELTIDDDLATEIEQVLDGIKLTEPSEKCARYVEVYNSLINVDGQYFGSFFDYEYSNNQNVTMLSYYPKGYMGFSVDEYDYFLYLNDDIETYLRDLSNIIKQKPNSIGIRTSDRAVSKGMLESLLAYCNHNNIMACYHFELLEDEKQQEDDLIKIAKESIGMKYFTSFRNISFYKNPDIDKETIEISQRQIIRDIIQQAENSYEDGKSFRDIFITAPTGAGKSVMFQIPAVYLAQKYGKMTIIIEPIKALMQDQKDNLNKNGYNRVETFNSDLITQAEKEAVIKRIKNGEVDLLYLSPETLLSYSIETIIGDRDIGLLIIDEAHIVTTWGQGFRPDYWYLGGYINKLRHQLQYGQSYKRKIYHFPICACTATAINGGVDDSVGETIISLYMENPIKYIGYTRRDDIKFVINDYSSEKLSTPDYEKRKVLHINSNLDTWMNKGEKTIVYFPYASYVRNAKEGTRGFAGIKISDKIGTYFGRKYDDESNEYFNAQKRDAFEKFKSSINRVMFATKAFGMGVDINDIVNIYHYAPSGNLCDYVQEIGRAARKKELTGYAITDFYQNDLKFMKILFGMSQIQQYQIQKVLKEIYRTYQDKKSRNFLISPESFTYIFDCDEDRAVNLLKTCLLMLEKDLYDKYNYKVLVSRPQGIFTKAFVVVQKDKETKVLNSKYGKCFKFVKKGANRERQYDGATHTDYGDIYSLDLKAIWEEFHPNISFAYFKYLYFDGNKSNNQKAIKVMPEIREYIFPRQQVTIRSASDYKLYELKDKILEDFEYVANELHSNFGNGYFTIDDFAKLINKKFGKIKSLMISNTILDLADPEHKCVKHRENASLGKIEYSLSNGNFKEYLRATITKANIILKISGIDDKKYLSYIGIGNKANTNALKMLSIFGYISYDVVGGEEPEIFIRLNDPNKIEAIANEHIRYSNDYVTRAKQKHNRDVDIMVRFFSELKTNEERWNFIEDYFLGHDVLENFIRKIEKIEMKKCINKVHSSSTENFKSWNDLYQYIDEEEISYIQPLEENDIPLPEYTKTTIKKSYLGDCIKMSWPSKNVLICDDDTPNDAFEEFIARGWIAYRISEIDYLKIGMELG